MFLCVARAHLHVECTFRVSGRSKLEAFGAAFDIPRLSSLVLPEFRSQALISDLQPAHLNLPPTPSRHCSLAV